MFCLNDDIVSWNSSKQGTITDSTTKTKYIDTFSATKEDVWIRKFIVDIGVVSSITNPIDLYCDNNGVIAQTKKPKSH